MGNDSKTNVGLIPDIGFSAKKGVTKNLIKFLIMNLTLKELVEIHSWQGHKPPVVSLIIHNLLSLKDIERAKPYIETLFKEELSEVQDIHKDMVAWCELLQFLLKQSIRQLEGVEKPVQYRKYLQDLLGLNFSEYLKYLNTKTKSDEFYFIGEVALKLKRTERTIRTYMSEGRLDHKRDGADKVIITKKSVEAFLSGVY